MKNPIVYDKGKYHDETVMNNNLPEERASVHTALFLGWLIENKLYSEKFSLESQELIVAYKEKQKTAVEIYEWWDRCLIDDMLNDEGNQFAQAYFNFETGQYIQDYLALLVKNLPSEFHVPYTWKNQEIMSTQISKRYLMWKKKQNKKPWEFWK